MPAHGRPTSPPRASWLPMIIIVLGQALLAFNFAALSISMGGMVVSFKTPPTTVGAAIVLHALAVSAFILLGAKLGQRFGSKSFFQASTALFLGAMVLMAMSWSVAVMLAAQALAGFAGAGLRPTLVVLIANHYHGRQQSEALGWLGAARAMAGVLAFVLIGILERFVSWRLAFGLLVLIAGATLALSFTLKASPRRTDVSFDFVGVCLSATAVVVFTFGLNQLSHWGVWWARPTAPIDILGRSPAPLMIVAGLVLGWVFVTWTRRRIAEKKIPLLDLAIVQAPPERAAANNLSASVGTALMGALLVGVLSANVMAYVNASPVITAELREQLDLDSVNFLSNDRLVERLERTTATPEEVIEAVRINASTRPRSLKLAFLALGALSLLAIFPASRLPRYKPGEVPPERA